MIDVRGHGRSRINNPDKPVLQICISLGLRKSWMKGFLCTETVGDRMCASCLPGGAQLSAGCMSNLNSTHDRFNQV